MPLSSSVVQHSGAGEPSAWFAYNTRLMLSLVLQDAFCLADPPGPLQNLTPLAACCLAQVRKADEELTVAFGSGPQLQAPPPAPSADGQPKMVTVMLFGNANECEKAQRLIEEAVDNKEQKAKQRQKVS